MNQNMYKDLVELGIFESKALSEEAYKEGIANNKDDSIIYLKGEYNDSISGTVTWFRQVDTKGLSIDDIKLQLAIVQAKEVKEIKSIRKMVSFLLF